VGGLLLLPDTPFWDLVDSFRGALEHVGRTYRRELLDATSIQVELHGVSTLKCCSFAIRAWLEISPAINNSYPLWTPGAAKKIQSRNKTVVKDLRVDPFSQITKDSILCCNLQLVRLLLMKRQRSPLYLAECRGSMPVAETLGPDVDGKHTHLHDIRYQMRSAPFTTSMH
jgi:hypothetical protein